MIRKAVPADVEAIAEIYEKIHTEEEAGRVTIGWARGVYPTKNTAEDAIQIGDMFVEISDEGKVVAAGRLNHIQMPEYALAKWDYPAADEEVMVLHTLVVDPEQEGKGYAGEFLDFYESYSLENGCHYLRIDTQEKNVRARRMYQKRKYKEVSVVSCTFNGISGVQLICLEKKI